MSANDLEAVNDILKEINIHLISCSLTVYVLTK
jgi:hypothetical protein